MITAALKPASSITTRTLSTNSFRCTIIDAELQSRLTVKSETSGSSETSSVIADEQAAHVIPSIDRETW